jgi:PadR family transcriptional regulator, regulatory protein PadR
MISSDVIRGYNDTLILSILEKEKSYAYEISKKIKMISQEKYIIKETTLYSAINRLESNAYIKAIESDDRRTYYEITSLGKAYLDEKRLEWMTTQDVINQFI